MGFCTGNCIAACTRFGMSIYGAGYDELVFAGALVNAIQYQQYCAGTWWGFGGLGWLAIQCQTHHG